VGYRETTQGKRERDHEGGAGGKKGWKEDERREVAAETHIEVTAHHLCLACLVPRCLVSAFPFGHRFTLAR